MTANGSVELPAPKKTPGRVERIPLGIAYMIAATVVFATSSAIAKWQGEVYPVGEFMFLRTLASLATVSLIILPRTGLAVFRTQRLKAHVMRNGAQGVSQTLIVLAFSLMPLPLRGFRTHGADDDGGGDADA